jgi:nucleotide-binding universal stress UspA family protein
MTRILVPLDGSNRAEAALPFAINLAHNTDGTLYLFNAASQDLHEAEVMQKYLAKTSQSIRQCTECRVQAIMRAGDPIAAIKRHAHELNATAIIMSRQGQTGRPGRTLGRVSSAVTQQCAVPVLLVQRALTIPNHNRLLIPLNGSYEAEAVLPNAILFARLLHLPVTLLRVVPEVEQVASPYGTRVITNIAEWESSSEAQLVREYLNGIATCLRDTGVPVETLVQVGDPAQTIIDYVDNKGADLVALATQREQQQNHRIFGHVVDTILREVEVPLLLQCVPQPVAITVPPKLVATASLS